MQSKCLIRVVVFWFSILLLDRFVFSSACGADTPSPSSQSLHFERDVRPILKAHCFQCHGEDGVVEADIDLRQVRLMRQSGAIDATDPSSSLLLEQIRTGTMPKGGKPLDSKSIETIEKWIEQGALTGKEEPSEVPSHFITDEERNHWSFRSIVAPSIPDVACDNPIDAFVSVMQGSKSLQFAEQADRITLLEERLLAVDEALRESVRKAWMTEKDKRSKEDKELLEKHDFTFFYAEHLPFLPDRDAQETRREALVHEAVSIREQKMSRVLMAADEKRDIIPKTLRFHRGDYRQPKEEVAPGDLSIFEGPEIPTKSLNLGSSGRRLAYARWLTSGEHPTVARVLVNRFWAQHFGKGLVESLADFGMRTSRPVQGDLLDWLASDFQQSGWRLKRFHKLVMTSKTYMQQSRNPAAESIDSENNYLARKQLRRLEAESVRDSILFVSGNLLSSLGGKPIGVARHPKGGVVLGKELSNPSNGVVHTVESWGDSANRRSLYVQNLRNRPLTVLQTFDMPVMTPNCNQRVTTTVAPQSLMMLNDSFVVEQSQVLASRLMAEQPDRIADQMKQLWLLAFGCEPTDFETAEGIAMVADEFPRQLEKGATASIASQRALAALCQIVLASNRFLYAP